MSGVGISIKGLQEAMAQNARQIAALKPEGARGHALLYGLTALHRYAVSITHVWIFKGGGLRASHRMSVTEPGERGRIYIDPAAINPRGQRPAKYGIFEHARGGDHAFYDRTIAEAGPAITEEMKRMMLEGIVGGRA